MAERAALAARVNGHPLIAAATGALAGEPVSAVGGVVRDALLGVEPGGEVDLVVEGDALELARALARRLGGEVELHPRFGTAEVTIGGGRIDIVGARSERYPAPGALPEVRPGTLEDDLARRDFTVNAMAYGLSGPRAGDFMDPHGGLADLDRRLLRTLRPGSFREDPSRLVRAARYIARLGMSLAPELAPEARAAARDLDLRSARVADELARLLDERAAGVAMEALADLGVPWAAPGAPAAIAAVDGAWATGGAPPLPLWALRAGAAIAPAALEDAALPGWALTLARQVRAGAGLVPELRAAGSRSAVDAVLRRARRRRGAGRRR